MIIFFFHIPKTAGSSISLAARSTLSRANTVIVEDTRPEQLVARLQQLAKLPDTFFVQGHITPSQELLSIPMKRITVLRQAGERLISHFCYCYERRFYDLKQLEFFRNRKNYARAQFDEEDLVEWITRFNMDDFQVRFLSGEYGEKLTDESLGRAIRTLSSLDFVATTENLGEFFEVLGGLTRRKFDLAGVQHTNRSNKSLLRLSERDREFIYKEFCQRDEKLVRECFDSKEQKYRSLQANFLSNVDRENQQNTRRILKLLSTNKTLREIFFKIKRRSVGIALQSMEAMGNLVSRG